MINIDLDIRAEYYVGITSVNVEVAYFQAYCRVSQHKDGSVALSQVIQSRFRSLIRSQGQSYGFL